MIINESDYNPLKELFKYDLTNITSDVLMLIQHELFKGGIVAESKEEFKWVLDLLIETEKEFYGKK